MTERMQCYKCKADVLIPDLQKEIKEKVTSSIRVGNVLQAAMDLHTNAKIDLGNCKLIVFHLTRKFGSCHRCRTELTEQAEEQICPKCKSLNLNW